MNDQDPQIRTLLDQLNQWWVDNPHYIVQIETQGQFLNTKSTMYYFLDGANRRQYIGETRVLVPYEAHYLFQRPESIAYLWFPESKNYVASDAINAYEAFVSNTLGELSQANILVKSAKSRLLRESARELELIMDPAKLGVAPADVDFKLTLTYDAAPRFTKFVQVRLGLTQTTNLTYTSVNRAEVLAALPQLPPLNQVNSNLFFDEALKKDILYFRLRKTSEA